MRGYPKIYGTIVQTGVVNPASCQASEEWIGAVNCPSQPLLSTTGTPSVNTKRDEISSN
ncbi:hypothetical protein PC119_g26719, partial [Phytophthora cactorum]